MSSAAPTPEELANTPAAPPPPGLVSNFVNPETRSPLAIGLCSLIMALMIIFVFLRLYAKLIVIKKLYIEDYMCILAAVFTIAWTALLFDVMEGGGIGMHIWNVPLSVYTATYWNRFVATVIIYTFTPAVVKVSLFLLCLRVFGTKPIFTWSMYVGIATNVIFAIIAFILTTVWCAPAPGQPSMLSATGPKCQENAELLSIYQAGFNMLTDIYLLTTPLPIIFNLKITLRRKLGIGAIFMTGLLATVCSAVTLYYRIKIRHSVDPSWDWIPTQIISIYELNVGIICVCLPCLPVLLKDNNLKHLLSIRSWTRLYSKTSQYKASADESLVHDSRYKRFDQDGSTQKNPSLTQKSSRDQISVEMGDYSQHSDQIRRAQQV